MANEVRIDVKANTQQAQAALGQFQSKMKGLTSGLTDVKSALDLGSQAFRQVYQIIDQTITQYTSYADAMKKLSTITGTGTEATSRLVQAFDDLGVSQEASTQAMTTAARKGFVFTIENVAKLSDEYVKLQTQEEKNALLNKELGRGGLELARVFEQGGDAIRNAADAQADGMIVTAANAREAEKLRVAQDNLDDSMKALSNSIAKVAVPALTDLINSSMHATLTEENLSYELEKIPPQMRAGAIAAMEYRARMEGLNRDGLKLVTMFTQETEAGFLQARMMSSTLNPALNTVQQGYITIPGHIQDYITKTNEARAASEAMGKTLNEQLNLYMQEYNKQLLYKIASEGLSAQSAMQLAVSMGLVNEKTKFAADRTAELKQQLINGEITLTEYTRLINGMANGLDRIQSKQVMIDIYIRQHGGEQYTGPGSEDDQNPLHHAAGGNVQRGVPAIVGERGPELFVPSANGSIIPNSQVTNNHLGGNTFNFYITGSNANDIASKVKAKFGGAYQGM